nr:Zinc finger CCCH-type with G patch domain-containing protein [Ipomoea batatas]
MAADQATTANSRLSRQLGGTEQTWCKAVPGGTGITVSALLFSNPPEFSVISDAVGKLQTAHPILSSQIRHDPATGFFSYVTPATPHLKIQSFDSPSTAEILRELPNSDSVSDFHLIVEHELNRNDWRSPNPESHVDSDVFFAGVYALPGDKLAVALRLHTSACDSATAWTLCMELRALLGEEGIIQRELECETKIAPAMEDCIPEEKLRKPFWARGIDMFGYSMNSLRMSNLNFEDTESPRASNFVTLQINREDTNRILNGCKARGIKLSGLLSAAAMMSAYSSKGLLDYQQEKYAVVTLINCRSILDPVLSSNRAGFYHSGILNTHDIRGGEELWELAGRTYTAFADAKNNNKHFTDLADLNFLMSKAIENPGLTPSSSLRTSLISIFEETPVDDHGPRGYGVEDYAVCSSAHGVGPNIAIFNTIRGGELDCTCLYPSPLYSRKRMLELIDGMKRILVEANISPIIIAGTGSISEMVLYNQDVSSHVSVQEGKCNCQPFAMQPRAASMFLIRGFFLNLLWSSKRL